MVEFDIKFWKHSTEDTFNKMAEVLKKAGFTDPAAKEVLEILYDAVANEFGGC